MSSVRTRALPRELLLWLLIFGTLAPALFVAVYLVEGITRPGYDAWRDAISSLMNGERGWVQQANFAVLGVFTVGVALVWRRILEGGVCATAYPVARAIEGAALIAIAFTMTDPLHTVWLVLIVGAMMAGLFIMARRFWRDPSWRGWVFYSVTAGVLINVFIALFGVFQHTFAYAGLLERIATNIEPVWGLIVWVRLWSGVEFQVVS